MVLFIWSTSFFLKGIYFMNKLTSHILAAAVAGLFASYAQAEQYFVADFSNDASQGVIGNAPTFGGGAFVAGYGAGTNLAANPGRTGITRFFGGQSTAADADVTAGWGWKAPAVKTWDAKNQVFFVTRVMIDDTYASAGGYAGSWANGDVFGAGWDYGTAPVLFTNTSTTWSDPVASNNEGSGQMASLYWTGDYSNFPASTFPADRYNRDANNAAQADDAGKRAVADGVAKMTWVYRDQDATNMTVELIGGNSQVKHTYATPPSGVFNSFSGVKATPEFHKKSVNNNIYSNISAANGGMVQMGDVRFEVGVTAPSDFNLDYKTDLDDASVLLTNWQKPSGQTMFQGDANNDGAVNLDDASVMLTNWQGVHDTAVGTGKISVDVVGSIYVDLKGLALWKVFIGDAAHNAVSGTNLLTMDAGVSSLPGFAVGVSKQNNVDGSPEDFGATISSNVISTGTVITDPDTGDIIGYDPSTPKDTRVNLDLAAMTSSGRHLWLQYQVAGSAPLFTEIVPEPTSMALLGLVGVGLLALRSSAARR